MATIINQEELLFPGFLDDHRTYQLVVAYWQRLLKKILSDPKLTFHPFYTKQDGSGRRDYSANPIFDAYFPDHHKLLRIIQYLPEPDDRLFSAYIDYWQVANMEPERRPRPANSSQTLQPIPELVITLALTPNTADLARQLIRQWINEGASVKEMEAYFDRMDGEL